MNASKQVGIGEMAVGWIVFTVVSVVAYFVMAFVMGMIIGFVMAIGGAPPQQIQNAIARNQMLFNIVLMGLSLPVSFLVYYWTVRQFILSKIRLPQAQGGYGQGGQYAGGYGQQDANNPYSPPAGGPQPQYQNQAQFQGGGSPQQQQPQQWPQQPAQGQQPQWPFNQS